MHSCLVDCAAHKVAAAAALRYPGRLDALPDRVLDVRQYLPNAGILCCVFVGWMGERLIAKFIDGTCA
jgi:hypothetical protein